MKRLLTGAIILVVLLLAFGFWKLRSEMPKYSDAFLYAYGPYEFVRSIQDLSGQREAEGSMFSTDSIREASGGTTDGIVLNRHVHNRDLADHTLRSVTTPNNDTLYTSAVLELSQTPVEVILPSVGERYLSIALMDVFTDQFAHIGPRETGGAGGTYWIVGPEDTSVAPEGVQLIRATGNDVWLLARIFVSGQSDLDAARTAQSGIQVRPVHPDRQPTPYKTRVTEIEDSENFLAIVQEAMMRNAGHPQIARAEDFPELSPNKGAGYGPVARFFWSLVTPRAEAAISAQVTDQLSAQIAWSAPPEKIGYYGDDDRLRAGIALIGFGALRREDAIYYRMVRIEDGAALDGAKSYRMVLPENVPAQAFWSIALYEPDETGRFFFYENPTGRHSLNSGADGLVVREDGSVVLQMGPDAPTDSDANWLPTPDGTFAAFFRLYLPSDQAVENGWTPPAIEALERAES